MSDPLEPDTLQPFPEEVLPHSMSNIDNLGTPPECDTPQNSPTCVDPDVLESSTPIEQTLPLPQPGILGKPVLDVFGNADDTPPTIKKQTRSGKS